MTYNYPLRFLWKHTGEVVEFTGLREGTTVEQASSHHPVGYYSNTFNPHTGSSWKPVVPSVKLRLHDAVKLHKGR